jgi:hypothetical protein
MPLAPIGTEQAGDDSGCRRVRFQPYRDARGICRKKYVITATGAAAFLHRMWRPQFPPRVQFIRPLLDGLRLISSPQASLILIEAGTATVP